MASLLHKSTPWIEDSFVYACSFDASRFDDESDEEDNEFNDDEEIMEPSTQNTIPDGLHDNDDDDDNEGGIKEGSRKKNRPPPSRGGKIVQIIDRGGDVNFYKQKSNDDGGNDNNTNCCPPYLIIHDGQYSTIAFLSEEAYNSTVLRQHVRRGAKQQHIPKKSLISISQYTISTIKCCTQLTNSNNGSNSRGGAVFGLQLLRPDMPQPHLSQIQSTLNTNLLLCLYVLGPITLIGAENQGLIGNTINVNCSVKVRRVLQSHMAQFDKVHTAHNDACVNREEEDEEEDYQHWTMVQRLEACHCYYQLLKEKRGGTIPMWPWESRLVDGEEMEDENGEVVVEEDIETVSNKGPSSGANDDMDEVVDVEAQGEETVAAIATAASPGRVERMIRKYESLEELLEGDEENVEGDNDADVEGDDAADVVGDDDDHDVVETKVGRASTGTYLAKWDDSDEDQMDDEEGDEKEAEQEGNKGKDEEGGQHQQQQHRQNTEQDEGGEEKEQGPNTKNDDAQMEQGNVAELFDNFEDINEIIDLDEEDSPPTEEVVESTSAKLNDNPMDGDTVAEQGEDLDNNNDEDGNGNAATFVGIDQMFVDEEEEEVEEEQEEEDEDEQVPLLTQQEFGTHKEVQEEEEEEETEHEPDMPEPPQEVVASQIPIPRAAVNKGAKSSLEGDEHEDNICANEYVESQIPFPPPKDTQSSDESVREEIYEDVGTESQIPFPPHSKHQKQSLNDDEDEEVMSYPVESQIHFPQKHSSKKDHSPLKNINNKSSKSDHVRPKRTDLVIYDSDDSADWMRIRKAKTKAKSTKSTKKVQSQMAGEGSEESIPSSSTALNTSQILDQEEEEVEDDESAEEEMQQQPDLASIARKEPSSSADPSLLPPLNTETSRSARTSAHRVHFATDDTDLKPPEASGTQATNLRELFTSVSSKASNILFQSQSNDADTNEVVTRKKRKAKDDDRKEKKKEFSFATMFDRAKRSYCPSSASDDF